MTLQSLGTAPSSFFLFRPSTHMPPSSSESSHCLHLTSPSCPLHHNLLKQPLLLIKQCCMNVFHSKKCFMLAKYTIAQKIIRWIGCLVSWGISFDHFPLPTIITLNWYFHKISIKNSPIKILLFLFNEIKKQVTSLPLRNSFFLDLSCD